MAWKPIYIFLLLASVSVDWLAALRINGSKDDKTRKYWLYVSLGINLLILFIFKYSNFFLTSANEVVNAFGFNISLPGTSLILPLGISFYTFQAMSYAIDVYRKRISAEKSFLRYFLFIMFFPQLVAGPIERAGHLLPQFAVRQQFSYERVVSGLTLMAWGMFQKVVIADRLAVFVDQAYGRPELWSGPALLIATIFFAFQIYCDFAGYTDIAIGAARVFGIDIMQNFRRPYFATSIPEFWKRWNISLSTWFWDYVYIPLGGNRVPKFRWAANILTTFLLSGFWHGANWTFLIWGGLNGVYTLLFKATGQLGKKMFSWLHPVLAKGLAIVFTFILTLIAWVLFRANNIKDAWYVFTHAAKGWGEVISNPVILLLNQPRLDFIIAFASIIMLLGVHLIEELTLVPIVERIRKWPVWLRWGTYIIVIWLLIVLGKFGERQFIYFVF